MVYSTTWGYIYIHGYNNLLDQLILAPIILTSQYTTPLPAVLELLLIWYLFINHIVDVIGELATDFLHLTLAQHTVDHLNRGQHRIRQCVQGYSNLLPQSMSMQYTHTRVTVTSQIGRRHCVVQICGLWPEYQYLLFLSVYLLLVVCFNRRSLYVCISNSIQTHLLPCPARNYHSFGLSLRAAAALLRIEAASFNSTGKGT